MTSSSPHFTLNGAPCPVAGHPDIRALLVSLNDEPAFAQTMAPASCTTPANPMVGGAPMYANKNIVENAAASKDHTTLVAAVKAAGLVETLQGPGPFTVFAPTDAAFAKLPAGTVEMLVKPENKAKLTKILTCHVVSANAMSPAIAKMIASEAAMEIALNAVRIHCGYGYSTEYDVERYFRDAPLMIVGEGTNEIQRNDIAAQLVSRGGI